VEATINDNKNNISKTSTEVILMKFMLIVIITMGAMGHDPKTIEMRIPQKNKAECLKSAKTFEFKLPIPGIVVSMTSRCEPKSDEEQPEVKQVET
tara:strand:+ start:152 stop:436 length:285 start_codon:yes stop_codon:yes gene_type:complete